MGTDPSSPGGRRGREPAQGSVGLMLGFVGAATAVFFLVLALVGLAILALLLYYTYGYYR